MDILLFPYLPLRRRAELGGWELVPTGMVELSDTSSEEDFARVGQLVGLYEPPRGAVGRLGAVVRPNRGKIGDAVDRSLMKPLRQSVLAAALDVNPTRTIPPDEPASDGDEDEDVGDDEGNVVYTSDSATLWGHTFIDREVVSVEYGSLVRALVGGIRLGAREGRIAAPVELHVPSLAGDLDADYGDAFYSLSPLAMRSHGCWHERLTGLISLGATRHPSPRAFALLAFIRGWRFCSASLMTRRSYERLFHDCSTTKTRCERSDAGSAANANRAAL